MFGAVGRDLLRVNHFSSESEFSACLGNGEVGMWEIEWG
jgi:hypothetical protein